MAEALRTKTDLSELPKDAALFKEAAYINGEWVTGASRITLTNSVQPNASIYCRDTMNYFATQGTA